VESSGLTTVPLGFEMTWGIKVGTPDGAAVEVIPGARLSDDCVMSVVGSHMLVSVLVAVGETVITISVDEAAAEEVGAEVIVADPVSEVVGRVPLREPDVETVVVGAELSVVRVAVPEAELAVVEMTVPFPVVVGALPTLVVWALPEVVVVSVPLDDTVVSWLVGAALLSVVAIVLPAAVLVVVGVVVGAAVGDKSLVTDPRRLDKILPSPVLSVVVVEVAAADETEVVVKTPVEAAPLMPEVVVVGSKDPTKDESKDESSSGVVLVAAAEADVVVAASEVVVAGSEVVVAGSEVVVAASEVVVAAAEVVGTTTLDMSDTIELSKLLRGSERPEALVVVDVVVLDAAVDPPVPENETPDDVTLESEVVVGAAASVVLELVVKTPPGPKVIPPSVDAAAEVVVGTKALVSVVEDVGAIITEGSNPVDPIRRSLVVVGGDGVGSIPTTVVCWITTVVVDIAAELELVGTEGNRLFNKFPVPAAEPNPDVSEFVPVIPFKKSPNDERFVVAEKTSCELSSVSFGVWVVIVEFWNIGLLIDLGK
jgi:hypothetical protein